ncbi:MAG: hypothetical protein KDJ75_02285 [Alphaproteobacteria bacterium]|nr:hypothetical protein [Alphaproteobacteria bacterium]
MNKAALTLSMSLCLILAVPGQSFARTETIGAPDSGVELGLGWDTQTASMIPNRCIEFAPVRETGQTINMKISDVSDSSEVSESLNVSASMSVKAAFGSASAQAEFSSSSKVSAMGNSILVRATVDNGVLFAGPPKSPEITRDAFSNIAEKLYKSPLSSWTEDDLPAQVSLSQEAQKILGSGSARELKAFEKMCGDSYVSAIYSGAEMLAIMSFKSASRSDAQKAQASVKAAFSAWGVSGSGSSSAGGSSQVDQTNTTITIDYTQIGGAGGIIPTSKDEFFEKLRALPKEALDGPQFHSVDITPYNELPGWPATIALDTEEDALDVTLTDYYATLGSVNFMIDDLLTGEGKETASPQEARLKLLQDKVTDYRSRIYALLKESYILGDEAQNTVKKRFAWSRPSKAEQERARRYATLDENMAALRDELVAFSFGRKNPNLVKLYLPTPEEALPNAKETDQQKQARGKAVIEFYLEKQAKRICTNNPASEECLKNSTLEALGVCVPAPDLWLDIPEGCSGLPEAQIQDDSQNNEEQSG